VSKDRERRDTKDGEKRNGRDDKDSDKAAKEPETQDKDRDKDKDRKDDRENGDRRNSPPRRPSPKRPSPKRPSPRRQSPRRPSPTRRPSPPKQRSSRSRSPPRRRNRGAVPFGERSRKDLEERKAAADGPKITGDMNEDEIMAMMGVPSGFDTTKGKKVVDGGASTGISRLKSKRHYRQYMNRRGGFNRPLAPTQ